MVFRVKLSARASGGLATRRRPWRELLSTAGRAAVHRGRPRLTRPPYARRHRLFKSGWRTVAGAVQWAADRGGLAQAATPTAGLVRSCGARCSFSLFSGVEEEVGVLCRACGLHSIAHNAAEERRIPPPRHLACTLDATMENAY